MKLNCSLESVKKASDIIVNGGIVVFPTDTVYGIGCTPYNKESIEKIFKIKNREKTKSLPILAFSLNTIKTITEIDEKSRKLAEKFWPGPLTLILKLTDDKLKKILLLDKIAIRVPNHYQLLAMLKECKFIIGTSANISGESSFVDPEKCYQSLTNFDLFLDGGKIQSLGESTIVEVENGKIIIHREGVIKREKIFEQL